MSRGRRVLAVVLVLCMMAGMVAWPDGAQRVKAETLTETFPKPPAELGRIVYASGGKQSTRIKTPVV